MLQWTQLVLDQECSGGLGTGDLHSDSTNLENFRPAAASLPNLLHRDVVRMT